jgi:phosphate/sulfate permease
MNPWIRYSLVRVGIFLAAFAVLFLLLPAPLAAVQVTGLAVVVIAAAVAAIISLAISYIFFARLREAVARDLTERRQRPVADPDALDEDAAAESAASPMTEEGRS